MSEWKPGDVAMVTAANRRNEYPAFYDGETWRECGSAMFCVDQPTSHRPLVVVDSVQVMVDGTFDREFVGPDSLARIVRNIADHLASDDVPSWIAVLNALAAALEPTPPKPDEPTGLGAVVEDADGERYVRHGSADLDDSVAWCNSIGVGHSWERIAAVKVLSEGVTV